MPLIKKKVCMAGAFAVGKTSLVRRFVESVFEDKYHTTVGVKTDSKDVDVDGQAMKLMLWDLAGEDDLAQLRPSHVRGADGFILVVDGCRGSTLETAVSLEKQITGEVGPVPFVLALNKSDRALDWEISSAAITPLTKRGWTFLATSAKDGSNVEKLFHTLARKMLKPKE